MYAGTNPYFIIDEHDLKWHSLWGRKYWLGLGCVHVNWMFWRVLKPCFGTLCDLVCWEAIHHVVRIIEARRNESVNETFGFSFVQIASYFLDIPDRKESSLNEIMRRSTRNFNIPTLPSHPSRPNPGQLTILYARGVGNLTGKAFSGVGNLTFS